jgi:hypothetical protein
MDEPAMVEMPEKDNLELYPLREHESQVVSQSSGSNVELQTLKLNQFVSNAFKDIKVIDWDNEIQICQSHRQDADLELGCCCSDDHELKTIEESTTMENGWVPNPLNGCTMDSSKDSTSFWEFTTPVTLCKNSCSSTSIRKLGLDQLLLSTSQQPKLKMLGSTVYLSQCALLLSDTIVKRCAQMSFRIRKPKLQANQEVDIQERVCRCQCSANANHGHNYDSTTISLSDEEEDHEDLTEDEMSRIQVLSDLYKESGNCENHLNDSSWRNTTSTNAIRPDTTNNYTPLNSTTSLLDAEESVAIVCGKVNGVLTTMLLDTGSSISAITESFAQQLHLETWYTDDLLVVTLANTHVERYPERMCMVTLHIGDLEICEELNVLPGQIYNVTLGKNWLKNHMAICDYGLDILRLPKSRPIRMGISAPYNSNIFPSFKDVINQKSKKSTRHHSHANFAASSS